MKKILPFLVLLLTFFVVIPIYGTNHYVDKNASGSNNGSSWSNAWESFSAINWGSISSGDVIYISGGNDSTVYNGTLNIGKSGVNGNRIVITKGIDSGHNGEVVIDGQNSRSNCIDEQGHDYITISNLKMKNWSDVGIDMDGASEALVSHCRFFHTQGIEVLKIRNSSNVIIEYCTSDQTPTPNSGSFGGNGDFLQAYNGSNYTFRYNHITLRNINADDHCDVFQMYDMVGDVYAYGNFYQHLDTKTNNAQGIYMTTSNITLYCYNNIAYFPYAKSAIGVNNTSSSYTGHIVAYGNTFYQGEGSVGNCIWLQYFAPGNIIKNNILVSMSNTAPIYFGTGSGTPSIDYNTLYAPNSNAIGGYNGSKTWSQWQSAGFDIHGKNADPKFKNIGSKDFSLQENSPALDAGMTAGNPYNIDIMGISRPQGQNYDMGAYEYNGGNPNPDTTPPEVTGASITNQTKVVVSFSEALQAAGAQNAANYSISGGVTVSSAVMNGTQVTLTTSTHSFNQQYTVTVSSVKDLAGNLINPNANSAQYLLQGDATPPKVTGASITATTVVIVTFSEALEQNSAQTAGNYSITNGITVSGATLSTDGKKVTLTTSQHTSGQSYVVTVTNVKDVAGNIVDPGANTAGYSFFNDTTPPELTGATLSGNRIVLLTFSEELDENSAEVANNYSIDKGISIDSATLLNGGTVVSLATSSHSPNTVYTVTVNNVKDLSGNIISSQANSFQYQKVSGGGGGKRKINVSNASAEWFQNYIPDNSIDGYLDPTSESRWAGVLPMPDSIVFDLDAINTINETHFSFYRWDQGRTYRFSVQVSVDGLNWTEVLTDMISSSSQWTINQFDSVEARYVKLISLSNNESEWAGLWEAEIWGPDHTTNNELNDRIPTDFSLEQNYPNPFNPTTSIKFNIPSDQHVRLNVYNIIGELVTELVNREYSAGNYAVEFNAADLPSGIYIYRLESPSFTSVRKMILIK